MWFITLFYFYSSLMGQFDYFLSPTISFIVSLPPSLSIYIYMGGVSWMGLLCVLPLHVNLYHIISGHFSRISIGLFLHVIKLTDFKYLLFDIFSRFRNCSAGIASSALFSQTFLICTYIYIYIYILYIYIVIHRQTDPLYQNSSVSINTRDASSWDRNSAEFMSIRYLTPDALSFVE